MRLSPCQEKALPILEAGDTNVFLTGSAGSGKSFLIREFLRNKDRKTFPVVASTGAAAVLVGGRTFHSFFGLGIMEGGFDKTVMKALLDKRLDNRLKKVDGFILDEVSMIPGIALRAAETICRIVRESEEPWGGIRVVAVGDFAQLPPVSQRGQARDWAFQDESWGRSQFYSVVLHSIMRSEDEEYVTVLNQIRSGEVDNEVEAYLNRKTDPDTIDTSMTHLFSRRAAAEKFSQDRLAEINQPLTTVDTIYAGKKPAIERFRKVAPVSEELHLKLGALVMLRVNDPQWRYVNGSVGTVEKIGDESLMIRLRNGRGVEVAKHTFSLMDADGTIIASACNFPVSLAYATTIHKSQGATLDSLVADLRGLWDPGQAYVALSRLRSGSGLTLTGWDLGSIRVAPEVLAFHLSL